MEQDLDLTPQISTSNIQEIDSINRSLAKFLEKMRETCSGSERSAMIFLQQMRK
jgi:hypothetical protein